MGPRKTSRPVVEVPKPIAYSTVVPESDFQAGEEYLDYLRGEEKSLFDLEQRVLGNEEKQRYDQALYDMAEHGSYAASMDVGDSYFKVDPKITKGFTSAFTNAKKDVDLARDEFEKTQQGGAPDPTPTEPAKPQSGKNLSDYMRFLENYDHAARGAGSKKGTKRFSGLDVRFVRDAAKDYNITDEQRNKAIQDAVKKYREDGVKMGGRTTAQLENLFMGKEKAKAKRAEAKQKSKDHKKKGKGKDKDKDKDKIDWNNLGKKGDNR